MGPCHWLTAKNIFSGCKCEDIIKPLAGWCSCMFTWKSQDQRDRVHVYVDVKNTFNFTNYFSPILLKFMTGPKTISQGSHISFKLKTQRGEKVIKEVPSVRRYIQSVYNFKLYSSCPGAYWNLFCINPYGVPCFSSHTPLTPHVSKSYSPLRRL